MKRSLTQLRTDSRDCLAGNYGLCFIALFVLFLANLVLNQLVFLLPYPSSMAASLICDLFISILGSLPMTMLQAGLFFLCLNIARYGRPQFSDIFLAFRYDPGKAAILCLIIGAVDSICAFPFSLALNELLVYSRIVLPGGKTLSLPASIGIFLLSLLLMAVLEIIFMFPLSQALFLYIDHQEYTAVECLGHSRSLMRGRLLDYVKLHLSLAGYFALSIVSLGVGLIWVIPYLNVCRANFYMDLTGTYKPY